METIDKNPVPIYETVCCGCKSKIRYKANEVWLCHIACPECGVMLWANTICPVAYEKPKEGTP